MSEISDIHNDQLVEKRLSADYWHSHFRSKENSGLNQAEYCRRHGIKYDAFQYWKQKLCKTQSSSSLKFVEIRNESSELEGSIGRIGKVPGAELNLAFPLIHPSCPQLPSPCSIRFWVEGYCIEVGNNFSSGCLVELIRTLMTLGKVGNVKLDSLSAVSPLGSVVGSI